MNAIYNLRVEKLFFLVRLYMCNQSTQHLHFTTNEFESSTPLLPFQKEGRNRKLGE